MAKKVIIIGAGIAGLSAGCYARMNGYEAEIYESHNMPGGVPTGVMTSRDIIQVMCRKDKKRFETSIPQSK